MAQKLTALLDLLDELSTSGGILDPETKQKLIAELRSPAVLDPLLRYLQLNHPVLTQKKQIEKSTHSFNPGLKGTSFDVESTEPDYTHDVLDFYDKIVAVGAQGTPIEGKTLIFKHDDVDGQDFLDSFGDFVSYRKTEKKDEAQSEGATDETPTTDAQPLPNTDSHQGGFDFGSKGSNDQQPTDGGGSEAPGEMAQAQVPQRPPEQEPRRISRKPLVEQSLDQVINQSRTEFASLLEFQVVKALGLNNPDLKLDTVDLGPDFDRMMLSQVNREIVQLLREDGLQNYLDNGEFNVLKFRSTLWRRCLIHTAWMFDPELDPQKHPDIFALRQKALEQKAQIVKDWQAQPENQDKEIPQSQNSLVQVAPSAAPGNNPDPVVSLEQAQAEKAGIKTRQFKIEMSRVFARSEILNEQALDKLAAALESKTQVYDLPEAELFTIFNDLGLGSAWDTLDQASRFQMLGVIKKHHALNQGTRLNSFAQIPEATSPAGLDLNALLGNDRANWAFLKHLTNAGMVESDARVLEQLYRHYALAGGHPDEFLVHLKDITQGKLNRSYFESVFGKLGRVPQNQDIIAELQSIVNHYEDVARKHPLSTLVASNAVHEHQVGIATEVGSSTVLVTSASPQVSDNFQAVTILANHYTPDTIIRGIYGQNLNPQDDPNAIRFQNEYVNQLSDTQKKELAVFYGVLYRGQQDEAQLMRMVQIVGLNPGYSFNEEAATVYQQAMSEYMAYLSQDAQAWELYTQQAQIQNFLQTQNLLAADQTQQQAALQNYFNQLLFDQEVTADTPDGINLLQQRQTMLGQARGANRGGLLQRARQLLSASKLAPLAAVGAGIGGFIYTITQATSLAGGILGGAASGAVAGAGLGFLLPGVGVPIGAAIGAIAGGIGGGALTWAKLTGSGGEMASSLSTGLGNAANSTKALGEQFGTKIAEQASNVVAPGSGEMLATTTGIGQGFTASTTGLTLATVGGALATLGIGTLVLMNAVLSAFLPEVDTTYIGAQQGEFSRFVSITKKASPSKIENNYNSAAQTITYSITITPKDGFTIVPTALTDTFSYIGLRDAEKIPRINDTQLDTPLDHSEQTLVAANQIINTSLTESVSFEYSIQVTGEDVLVSNTFELSFNAIKDGQTLPDTLKAVASVTIGDPQLGCFEFGEAGVPMPGVEFSTQTWPQEFQEQFTRAYLAELGQNTTHATLLCGRGPITVYYLGDKRPWGGWAPSALKGNVVGLYVNAFETSAGTSSDSLTKYVIAHELMHIVAIRNPQLETDFQANRSAYNGCFTYPVYIDPENIKCSDWEAFAEAGMLYTYYQTYTARYGATSGKYDFKGLHPKEYDWFKENIFGGVEY